MLFDSTQREIVLTYADGLREKLAWYAHLLTTVEPGMRILADLDFTVTGMQRLRDGRTQIRGEIAIPQGMLAAALGITTYEEQLALAIITRSYQQLVDLHRQRHACAYSEDGSYIWPGESIYEKRYSEACISTKSGIEQATGINIFFTGPLSLKYTYPEGSKYFIDSSLVTANRIPVNDIPDGTTFKCGRLFIENTGEAITGEDLHRLVSAGTFCDPGKLDFSGQDPTMFSIGYAYVLSLDGCIHLLTPEEADALRHVSEKRADPLAEPFMHPAFLAIPISKRFEITTKQIDLLQIAQIRSRDRHLLDATLGLRELAPGEFPVSGYSLQETTPFTIPQGYIGKVYTHPMDERFVGRRHALGVASAIAHHLPSSIIDTGWSGPIRGEYLLHPTVGRVNHYMLLMLYATAKAGQEA